MNYCIHDYINESNPVEATDLAFEGLKGQIISHIKFNMTKIKQKIFNKDEAYLHYVKLITIEGIFKEWKINYINARKQLHETYNHNEMLNQLIDFNLEIEIKSQFLDYWRFVPCLKFKQK